MKIFQVSEFISSAFDITLNDIQKQDLFNYLELLYLNNNINDEILLNLIKYFLLILDNNKNHIDIYINILKSLSISKEDARKIFNLFKKIDLSYQMNISESTIIKIIMAINSYIIHNYNNDNDILLNVYNIYDTIRLNNKLSFQNKVKLYIICLKHNSNILDVRQIIGIINKFI